MWTILLGGFGALCGFFPYRRARNEHRKLIREIKAKLGKEYTADDLRLHDLKIQGTLAKVDKAIKDLASNPKIDPETAKREIEIWEIKRKGFVADEPKQRQFVIDAIAGHYGHRAPTMLIIAVCGGIGVLIGLFLDSFH